MSNEIFAFTLRTKQRLDAAGCVFDFTGDMIGRILSQHPKFKDDWDEASYDGDYSYDIESTKDF